MNRGYYTIEKRLVRKHSRADLSCMVVNRVRHFFVSTSLLGAQPWFRMDRHHAHTLVKAGTIA